ncbi:hypothetical protein P7K49_016739 [Saguinus oedipus]|uniref:Uncharacterized protein n=1 Tax=Saguinus oedipus TaxID=9490 RepID=A0ABQ9VCY6_SAGOE|nr:hypothetical protein P7K49_016739 [Saguinus oedipus]
MVTLGRAGGPGAPQEDRAFVCVGPRAAWALAGTTEHPNSLLDRAFRAGLQFGGRIDLPEHRLGALGHGSAPITPGPPNPSTLPVSSDNRCCAPRNESLGAPRPAAGLRDKPWPGGAGEPPSAALPACPAPGWPTGVGAGGGRQAPLTLGSSPARGQQQRGQQSQERRARPAVARPVHSSSRGGEHPRPRPGSWRSRDAGGVCKALCPSNLLPRLRPAASGCGERSLAWVRGSRA